MRCVRGEQGLTQLDVAGLVGLSDLINLVRGEETLQMRKALDVQSLLGLEVAVPKKF